MKPRILITLIFYILSITFSFSNTSFYYNKLSLVDGLSQSSVKSICRDHRGLLWIGTAYGLNRYDGSQLKQYFQDLKQHDYISGNKINFIKEDAKKNLWIGTENTIMRYNREQDKFEKLNSAAAQMQYPDCIELKDRIIFCSSEHLLIYTYATDDFRILSYQGKIKKIEVASKVEYFDENTLLIGSQKQGLYLCDLKTGQITKSEFHTSNSVTDICHDSQGNLWISSYGDGLYCYSKQGKLLNYFTTANSALSNDVILDLQLMKDGELWIATDGGGISILNLHSLSIRVIEHHPEDKYSIPVNSISCLNQDNQGSIWIGTIRSGLLSVKNGFIHSYTGSYPSSTSGLSENVVTSLYEDQSGYVWIGTDGNGLNRFDPQSGNFKHFPTTYKRKITSLTAYSDSELLLSFYRGGLYLFNKNTESLRPLQLSRHLEKLFKSSGISVNVRKVNNEQIVMLADSAYLYNILTKETVNLNNDTTVVWERALRFGDALSDRFIMYGSNSIFELVYENSALKLKRIATTENLRQGAIRSAVKDAAGNVWISVTGGLYLLKKGSRQFVEIENSFLKSPSTLCFAGDGSLWIGSSKGVYRYLINKNRFILYDQADGLNPNEFIEKAVLRTRNGHVYIGGVTGFSRITTPLTTSFTKEIKPELLEVFLNGERVNINYEQQPVKMELPADNRLFTIRLIVNDPDLFKRKQFRYKLVGFNKEFMAANGSDISFYNLAPGDYRLLVQYSNNNGEWSEPDELLYFNVNPF